MARALIHKVVIPGDKKKKTSFLNLFWCRKNFLLQSAIVQKEYFKNFERLQVTGKTAVSWHRVCGAGGHVYLDLSPLEGDVAITPFVHNQYFDRNPHSGLICE